MRFKTGNIDVETSYKKAANELVVPTPPIIMRTLEGKPVEEVRVVADMECVRNGKHLKHELAITDPETGETIPQSEATILLKRFAYAHFDGDGNEVEKVKDGKRLVLPVRYFAVQDGKEVEVSPFTRTEVIHVPDGNWVPSTSIEAFAIYGVYELFSDSPLTAMKLFEEAEKRIKQDVIGVTTFVHQEGFKQYYAFLCPTFKDGKFVWLMKLSDSKPRFDHLQDPPVKVKVPIREAPTLETMPPIQALVVAAKKK